MTGDELRRRRMALGLTQEQMATRLNVDHNSVSRWELGQRSIESAAMLDAAIRFIELEADADYQRWRDSQDAPLADAIIAADTTPDEDVPAF